MAYMAKLNFQQEELFKFRFKREPKKWTIEDVHELWLRTLTRADEVRSVITSIRKKITKEIKPNERGQYIVYCDSGFYGRTEKIEFSWHNDWRSYGISRDLLEFSKDIKLARQEKIDFLIQNERAFELGSEYNEACKYQSNINYKVGHILNEMVQDKLRKYFKDIDSNPPKVLTIKIGDYEYYVKSDEQHRYGNYLVFDLCNKVIKPLEM